MNYQDIPGPALVALGTFETTERMRTRINMVMRSGRISYGPYCSEFETRFALRHSSRYGVLSNSGTSSLQVALQALKILNGWEDGDEVLLPALTFVATLNAVLHAGLKPVLVDVTLPYYDMDADALMYAVTGRTRAVIGVSLFGQPCDLPFLRRFCNSWHLSLVEDSCETVGVTIGGAPVGSWGDVGVFSFYVAHVLVAGVGGIAVTPDDALAKLMRSLVNHGIDLSELPTGDTYDPTFLGRKFRFIHAGHSFRITEFEAAIALAQLEDLNSIITQRKAVAATWDELLTPLSDYLRLPQVRPGSESCWMMYPLLLHDSIDKYDFMHYLAGQKIEVREMMPLTNQPYLKGIFDQDNYPVAGWINQHGVYIGCHQHIRHYEQQLATSRIASYLKEKSYANV